MAPLTLLSTLALTATVIVAQQPTLVPLKYIPLGIKAIRPTGWLARELRIQGDGLSGHLSDPGFYEPMYNTQWLGGTSTHEDWVEIFPYVLRGAVPQAILLNDTAQIAKYAAQLDYVLAHAGADGWIGPSGTNDASLVYWSRWPVLDAMFVMFEYTGNQMYIDASLKWLHAAEARLPRQPLNYGWSGVRYQDWLWVIQYLIDSPATPPAELPFLYALADTVYTAGSGVIDYERAWFVEGRFPTGAVPGNGCNLTNHGVNQGMAMKSGAMMYRQTGNTLGVTSSTERLALMDKYHGVPTGVFQADEHYAGTMPSHGTETCTVVELIFSHGVVHEVTGDATFADRMELVAYNALPGSMTKDMWARVYLQQNNEPVSVIQNNHVWISDGPDSIIYSLEGNYACCTSNFNLGWPRFIQKMVHATPDGGAAVSVLGPVTATLPNGATVAVDTEYPFGDVLTITVTGRPAGMPLYVRIPPWATAATVAVNGGAPAPVGAAAANTMLAVPLGGADGPTLTVVLDTRPAIVAAPWYNGAVAVRRGALVYALQLSEVFGVLASHGLGSRDYNITQAANTTTPWNAALVLDPANPGASLTFERVGPVPAAPFSSQEASCVIRAQARAVRAWGFARDGSAAPPPASPVDCAAPGACGPPVPVTLVPYGTTHLRMTQMPYTAA